MVTKQSTKHGNKVKKKKKKEQLTNWVRKKMWGCRGFDRGKKIIEKEDQDVE